MAHNRVPIALEKKKKIPCLVGLPLVVQSGEGLLSSASQGTNNTFPMPSLAIHIPLTDTLTSHP